MTECVEKGIRRALKRHTMAECVNNIAFIPFHPHYHFHFVYVSNTYFIMLSLTYLCSCLCCMFLMSALGVFSFLCVNGSGCNWWNCVIKYNRVSVLLIAIRSPSLFHTVELWCSRNNIKQPSIWLPLHFYGLYVLTEFSSTYYCDLHF